jgi:membrane protease YdiL (CAAX protease family)
MPSVPPPSAPSSSDSEPPPITEDGLGLPLWSAPAAVGLGFIGGQFVILIFELIAGVNLQHPTPAVEIAANILFDLAFVAAALYFVRLRGALDPAAIGFRRIPVRLGVAAFVTAGVGYYAVSFIYGAIVNVHGTDKVPKELGVDRSTAAAIAVTVFVCVVAPIAEEFFFRGFLFGVLRRGLGVVVAAVIVGILFGLAHTGSAQPQYLIPLGMLGFVLCLIRWRTRSLYPCMALHSANNALAIGVNQFHWNVGLILALMLGAGAVIAAVTGPLSRVP